jgi:phage terminase large subunit-like protein
MHDKMESSATEAPIQHQTLVGFALLNPDACCLAVEASRPALRTRFREVVDALEALARSFEMSSLGRVKPAEQRIAFANGSSLHFFSADAPERLRGLCPDATWVAAGSLRKLPEPLWHFRTQAGARSREFTILF